MTHGVFITLEGCEGSGKSTQIRKLVEGLRESGIDVVKTREPGGTPSAELIRQLVVSGDVDRWDAISELLMMCAARNEHVQQLIKPALQAGKWVVCDRFIDSTVAYQGYAGNVNLKVIEALNALVLHDLKPDVTFMLDLPPEEGLERTLRRSNAENRFESKGLEFHQKLYEGFKTIAEQESERCVIIDATQSINAVQVAMRNVIAERFDITLGAP